MSKIKYFFSNLFGAGSRLLFVEKMILDCVKEHLNTHMSELWCNQVKLINKIQRLPGGVEVDFYRMKGGRPSFDEELSFPNKAEELLLAHVSMELPGMKENLSAKVWCVKGFIFSIEYEGCVDYFVDAADMEPRPEFVFLCKLNADLEKAS